MAQIKTHSTGDSVGTLIGEIADDARREDCRALLELMKRATGVEPVVWSSGVIGFGTFHYKSSSGQEGDWFPVGFASRKAAITVYLGVSLDGLAELLTKLGKHTTGKGCIYIKRLSDVDLAVLEDDLGFFPDYRAVLLWRTAIDALANAAREGHPCRFHRTRASMSEQIVVQDREELIYLLCEAAEFEHTVMCSYLYAQWSLKRDASEGVTPTELAAIERWRRSLGRVALEEMLHLSRVNNLLAAIGAAPAKSWRIASAHAAMADVTPERVRWLWQARIPLGKVTVILAPPPGLTLENDHITLPGLDTGETKLFRIGHGPVRKGRYPVRITVLYRSGDQERTMEFTRTVYAGIPAEPETID
mgnify:CR=1 FL=1